MSILNWIGGHSLNFLDKLNWNPQITPNSTSDCQVNLSSPASITVANATINSLDTNANATLSVVSADTFTILGLPDVVELDRRQHEQRHDCAELRLRPLSRRPVHQRRSAEHGRKIRCLGEQQLQQPRHNQSVRRLHGGPVPHRRGHQ